MVALARNQLTRRVAAAALAVVAGCAGLWVSLLAGIYSSAFQHPDPNPALDGDPCCGHPDTWGDVLAGGIYFAATLLVVLGLLAAAVTLVAFGAAGRLPRLARSRAARWLEGVCLCCAIGVPLSWVVESLVVH